MADVYRWQAGEHLAVTGPTGVLLLDPQIGPELAEQAFAQLQEEATLGGILQLLTQTYDLWTIPSFALALRDGSTVQAVVRGPVHLQIQAADGTQSMSGKGVSTWTERLFEHVESFTVSWTDRVDGPTLPVTSAVLWASSLSWGDIPEPKSADSRESDSTDLPPASEPRVTSGDVPPAAVRTDPQPEAASTPDFSDDDQEGGPVSESTSVVPAEVDASPATSEVGNENERATGPDPAGSAAVAASAGLVTGAAVAGLTKADRATAPTPSDDLLPADQTPADRPDGDARVEESSPSEPAADAAAPADDDRAEPAEPPADLVDSSPVDSSPVDSSPVDSSSVEPVKQEDPADAGPEPTAMFPLTPSRPATRAGSETLQEWGKNPPNTPAEVLGGPVWGAPGENPAPEPKEPVFDWAGAHGGDTMSSPDLGVKLLGRMLGSPDQESEPTVLALLCDQGHASPPHSSFCSDCGARLSGSPQRVKRPGLGQLTLPSGEVILLTRSVIVGRSPSSARSSTADDPQLVTVASPNQEISRSHVEICLEGWSVLARDLGSSNGTLLVREGDEPVKLPGSDPLQLQSGDVLDLGEGVRLSLSELP